MWRRNDQSNRPRKSYVPKRAVCVRFVGMTVSYYTARNCVDAFGWEGAFKHATDALHDRIHCNELPVDDKEGG